MRARLLVTGDDARHSPMLLSAKEHGAPQDNEAALARGFRRGEDWATEQLIRKASPQVTALVRRLLAWPEDVEDVVHDVFVAALVARRRFRGSAKFATWITSIAVFRCRAHNRRRWIRHKLLAQQQQRTPQRLQPAASAGVERSEQIDRVRESIAELPHTYREVVVLYYLQHLSAAEVATVLGLKTNTVEKRLSRARAKLAKSLGGINDDA